PRTAVACRTLPSVSATEKNKLALCSGSTRWCERMRHVHVETVTGAFLSPRSGKSIVSISTALHWACRSRQHPANQPNRLNVATFKTRTRRACYSTPPDTAQTVIAP
ncbi:unnamed protein product, partial [Ectocarpus fasciculatus]